MSLTLIPTPIADDLPLEPVALALLLENAMNEDVILLVEEHKVGRQRWLKWGLPREAIEKFILYNEHTQEKLIPEIMKEMKLGKRVFLMSDCGLPAFCDPGQGLINTCHKQRVKVTSTPFPNSIALAIALSGFTHNRFNFSGFVPLKEPERSLWIKSELNRPETLIWMDTPYRLSKLLEEIVKSATGREIFLAMDLGHKTELLIRGHARELVKSIKDGEKREFVLVVAPSKVP